MKRLEKQVALLYHSGALGDFITIIPAIGYWKKHHENIRLVMLGDPAIGKFATEAGIVHDFLNVNQAHFAALFSDQFGPEISKLLAPFSQAIAFADGDSPLIANLRAVGIQCFYQPPFPPGRMHVVDYHLSLFTDELKLSQEEKTPHIEIPPDAMDEPDSAIPLETRPIAIHPGSGSAKKNWPFERFLSVADHVRAKGRKIVWIAGPAEKGLVFPEADYLFANNPLLAVARLLCRCELFIGNDSGVTHLAAALGCRAIALFGPSDPVVWAPRGNKVTVLYKNKPCSPCHFGKLNLCIGDQSCLNDISVQHVLSACPVI
jgi:ADP-heptose:LPS heptosyltransferase